MDNENYISNYFEGVLSAAEIKQFDTRIQEDPAFAGEVAFYYSALQAIKQQAGEDKKKRFRELYELQGMDKRNRPPLVYMNKWWKAAAAATILVFIAASWFWFSQPRLDTLADQYVNTNFTELRVTMGNNDSMQIAAGLYNQKKWKEALVMFERIMQSDTTNFTVIKNAGMASLQLKEYDRALKYFTQLENLSLSANPGKFYQALTLIRRNQAEDKPEAKKLLEDVVKQGLAEKTTAQQWLKKW